MKYTATLYNAQQAHQCLTALWAQVKPLLIAGHRLVVDIKPETRSADQNAKLHAELGEIAERVEWAGKKRDVETWKRLMTAAWLRARGESIEFLPALDGHGVDIVFRRTSELTRGECAELIEFVIAWKAEHLEAA
jgi:hypothetical protein